MEMDKSPPPLQPVGAQPFSAYCPHCHVELKVQPRFAGRQVSCPKCEGRFQIPMPQAQTSFAAHGGYSASQKSQLNPGIKICVLISGVGNVLLGLFWISTLVGAIIGIPQIVLAVFEFIFFAQADNKPLHQALSQSKTLAILEIISGLCNPFSLVCGILVLVFATNHKQ